MLRWVSPSRPTLLQAFLPVAEARGFFAREGVALAVAPGASTADAVEAVARGEAEFGMSAPLSSCPAIAAGAAVINVAQVAYRGFFEIASDPARPIRAASDLAGKRIGVVSARGGTNQQLDAMCLAAGIAPGTVARVVTGLGLDGLAPLRRGEIDGFFVFYESRDALEQAGEALQYLAVDDVVPMPGGAILARRDMVEDPSRHAELRGVIRACLRAIAVLRDPDAEDEVIALQPRAALGSLSPAGTRRVLRRIAASFAPPRGLPQGSMEEAAWTAALARMRALGMLRTPPALAEVMTNAFLP